MYYVYAAYYRYVLYVCSCSLIPSLASSLFLSCFPCFPSISLLFPLFLLCFPLVFSLSLLFPLYFPCFFSISLLFSLFPFCFPSISLVSPLFPFRNNPKTSILALKTRNKHLKHHFLA